MCMCIRMMFVLTFFPCPTVHQSFFVYIYNAIE